MKARRKKIPADITLVPLIDLFMIVLVFFMISTSFSKEAAFKVSLPNAEVGEEAKESQVSVVTLGPQGELAYNGDDITFENLKIKMGVLAETEKREEPIYLRADEHASHGKVVEIMDMIKKQGLKKVAIITELVKVGSDG